MNARKTTAALTALAIALWAAGSLAATFTTPPDVPPLSRPNMVVLVLSSSMLLALLTSCQVRCHADGTSPQPQGPLSTRSLALVLLSGAAITAMALVLTMPDAPAPASTPWLASVYAAAAITLTTAVRLILESAPAPPPR